MYDASKDTILKRVQVRPNEGDDKAGFDVIEVQVAKYAEGEAKIGIVKTVTFQKNGEPQTITSGKIGRVKPAYMKDVAEGINVCLAWMAEQNIS
jgi:hypothetical protein